MGAVVPKRIGFEVDGLKATPKYGGQSTLLDLNGVHGNDEYGFRPPGPVGGVLDQTFNHSDQMIKVPGTGYGDTLVMPAASDAPFKLCGGGDRIDARYWDDDKGDSYHTKLLGGSGTDVLVFSGVQADWTYKVMGKPGKHTRKMDHEESGRQVVLKDFEYLEFDDAKVLLVVWKFIIDRGQDNDVKRIQFTEDGKVLKTSKASKFMAHDEATPIKAGTCDAVYRTNSSKPSPVIEFAKSDGSSDVPGRTHIEIHNGNFTYHSEGCIVVSPARFPKKVGQIMDDKLIGNMLPEGHGSGITFYDLPMPIQVEARHVEGKVAQPKFGFRVKTKKVQEDDGIVELAFKYKNDGRVDGITKRTDVKFKLLKGSTGEKKDIAVAFSNEVKNAGRDTFRFTIDADDADGVVKIPVRIRLSDDGQDETVLFRIEDLTLFNVEPNGSVKKYADDDVASDLPLNAGADTFEMLVVDV